MLGVRSLFEMRGVRLLFLGCLGCDRLFGDVGNAIAKRDLGIAVWGCWGAIAQALTCQFAFGDVGSAIAKR